jgi:hypothetical protein
VLDEKPKFSVALRGGSGLRNNISKESEGRLFVSFLCKPVFRQISQADKSSGLIYRNTLLAACHSGFDCSAVQYSLGGSFFRYFISRHLTTCTNVTLSYSWYGVSYAYNCRHETEFCFKSLVAQLVTYSHFQ